uniref:Uncharacterized protein n=1 Tax=viral metagenome TaxID=1070528 RepID=A0A6C0DN93_9ZZZZ
MPFLVEFLSLFQQKKNPCHTLIQEFSNCERYTNTVSDVQWTDGSKILCYKEFLSLNECLSKDSSDSLR